MEHSPGHQEYLEQSRLYYDQRFGRDEVDAELSEDETQRLRAIRGALEAHLAPADANVKLNVLDFGCGKGWLSHYLARYGTVTGVDLSEKTVQRAQQRYPQARFLAHDITDGAIVDRLGPGQYDLVVSSEVVEHVLDQDAYFSNVSRLLNKDKSAFIMTTPNGRWKRNWFHGHRKAWAQPYELWLTREEIARKVNGQYKSARLNADFLSALRHGVGDDTVVCRSRRVLTPSR